MNPKSHSLTPCDFFLWGWVKIEVTEQNREYSNGDSNFELPLTLNLPLAGCRSVFKILRHLLKSDGYGNVWALKLCMNCITIALCLGDTAVSLPSSHQ